MAEDLSCYLEKVFICFATKLKLIRVRCKTEQFYINDCVEIFMSRNSWISLLFPCRYSMFKWTKCWKNKIEEQNKADCIYDKTVVFVLI